MNSLKNVHPHHIICYSFFITKKEVISLTEQTNEWSFILNLHLFAVPSRHSTNQ